MATLRAQLIDRLKDAESARFRNEFLSLSEAEENPVKSLCGEVNAKNSYGGYSGFKRYIVTTEGMVMMEDHIEGSIGFVWPVWCARPMR